MTTIIYKDGILAADTMFTRRNIANSDTVCAHCSKKSHNVHYARKIKINPKIKINNEQVLVTASAGSLNMRDKIYGLLEQGESINTIIKYANVFYKSSINSADTHFIFITNKHIYVVYINTRNGRIDSFNRKETIYLGSGRDFAKGLCNTLGMNAIDALGACCLEDESTGGHIEYLDLNNKELEIKSIKPPSKKVYNLKEPIIQTS